MILAATCATLAAMLATPGVGTQQGDTVQLRDECDKLEIKGRRFPYRVTIDASRAVVKSMIIWDSENITWRGGIIAAYGGGDGFAYDGYGLYMRGVKNVRITGVTFTDAKKAIVLTESEGVTIESNRFWRVREDGIIATKSRNTRIDGNDFTDSQPNPTTCTLPNGTVLRGIPARDCQGVFDDGNHADAIQVYDGMIDLKIRGNRITGNTQGIGQMGGSTSAPMKRVVVSDNHVAGSQAHQISLYACEDCLIARNVVRRGGTMKAIIRAGTAVRCGNDVQDEKADGGCP